jgi:hypothetical protein
MKFTANCPISKYDISGDGFYTCTIPRQNQTIFVVCASPEYKPFILTPTLDDVNQDNTTIHIDAFGEVIFNTTIPLTCKTAVCQNTTCAATITDLTPILCYPKTDACIQEPSLMLQIEPVVVEKLEIKDITLQNRVLSYTTNIPAICVANTPKSVVAQTKNNNNYQAIINQATQVKITCTTTDQTASYITLVN